MVKEFSYRGSARRFSNRYHFNGGSPADLAHWYALMDDIVDAEKAIFRDEAQIVECVGYAAGSELPVASKTYAVDGTATFIGWLPTPGQDAALIRYSTTARSTKNHPIYLFNYYHVVGHTSGESVDVLNTPQKNAMQTYADHWLTGFTDGTITAVRAGPNGATATSLLVHDNITHRDFPD